MSYRSFKRVLGETSLERKCRFLFGACLLLLITSSFWLYGWRTENLVYEKSSNTGRLLVDSIVRDYHWKKLETKQPYDDAVRASGEEDLIQDLIESLSNQEYNWKFIRPNSQDGTGEPADAFEHKVLSDFSRSPTPAEQAKKDEEEKSEASEEDAEAATNDEPKPTQLVEFRERRRTVDGKPVYEYYQPVRAKKGSCIVCHMALGASSVSTPGAGPQPLYEGDLLAVVKVTIPDDTQAALDKNKALLLASAIITVALAMVALYVIVRYVIVKPLTHLRDVSDEISHGHLNTRAEIQTGDEFEQLGLSFNRMLGHLVDAQQKLQNANDSLDGKVDELARVNMQLYEMNRLKSDFLATMSHELRTPLNSIIGFSDVLESAAALDDKQRRYVGNIKNSGNMLLEMINDILDLAKIESGKSELRLTDMELAHIVAAQCDMARPLSEKKNIDLETEIEPNLPKLRQDQTKIQQVLNNLLSNAIKFTPEGGRIVVKAQRSGADHVELIVSDTGVGISEEDQTAIFEKFRQGATVLSGGDAMTREYSGTGLGLSIVKELCKLLGGEIRLESSLGQGSTFIVRLPIVRVEEPKRDSTLANELDELTKPRSVELPRPVDVPFSSAPATTE
ncbi:MAG: HAMP domain-containing histidine kinase [Pirellulales bacterium]|nr:HAMP domain-containing histidine kinase [Pirellulales bacterium]